MLNLIDSFLNKINMYRLVLYFLLVLIGVATIFSFFNILPFDPLSLIFTAALLVLFSLFFNYIFTVVYQSPTNIESVYITALILALIITPVSSLNDLIFIGWAALLAIASKYILAINNKHLFNPAAIAVVLTAIAFNLSASWWVGNLPLMSFVLIGGLLIVRKIKREDMVFDFFISAIVIILSISIINGNNPLSVLNQLIFHTSLLFFAFVMLTEPKTTPPTKFWQIIYGFLIGLLFVPQLHIGSLYSTPELALVVGNLFVYLVSPKEKLTLLLKQKINVAEDIYDFVFSQPSQKLAFTPGQYMEWTLLHEKVDNRGIRRFLTIASSPTEDNLRIGVKIASPVSSFKKSLIDLGKSQSVIAEQRSGDFLLPKDATKKLVFIAGGIGITPFRSMIKYLLDTKQKRDIILLYSNRTATEIAYQEIFDQAEHELGIKTIYTLTDLEKIPAGWTGLKGRFNEEVIRQLPDFQNRQYFLSGPHNLVVAFENILNNIGVKRSQITKDYFPGFV